MINKVISINPNEGVSLKVTKQVIQLYDSAEKKNGKIVAFNELKSFALHLKDEREKALDSLKESEKWFKKGIDFLDKWERPYRVGETTEEDMDKISQLVNSYPNVSLDDMWENHDKLDSFKLGSLLHYIKDNEEFINEVDSIDLYGSAMEVYEKILQLDYLHLMLKRTEFAIQLLVEKRFSEKLRERDFKRGQQIENKSGSKPGPDTPARLRNDIRLVLEKILDKKKFLNKKGDVIIKRAVDYAADNPDFYKEWIDEKSPHKDGGYSIRHLQTLFSEEYGEMKSSNSS
ncbi:hypothetical protein [Fodinibius sp.]|uniref:hypothetical protein n=1 Tax=Fodinibius sp. TaxID=1872440 RepID=UPI002ACD90A9|nr:hypothetical protein [Fodinibius sp.]MDZ7659637.1 hypothetical protein [Fodinibius sp.]